MTAYLIPLWSTQCLLYQNYSQISSIITNFGHQIGLEDVILCLKDRHSLLREWFITSPRCIQMIRSASDRIYNPLTVIMVSFLPNIHSNFKQIYQVWRHQISPGNVMLSCDDRHDRSTLLCKCFPILLRCMKMISTVSGSISNSLMVNILSFIPNIC